MRQVRADLVPAPREGPGLDEERAGEDLAHDDLGLRRLGERKGETESPVRKGPRSRRQREVGLRHEAALEGARQALVRPRVDREQDDTRGVPVQPLVHRHVRPGPRRAQVPLDVSDEAGTRGVCGGVGGKARRLVDGQQHGVAEENGTIRQVEGLVRSLRAGGEEVRPDDGLDPLAHTQRPPRAPRNGTVDAHRAGRDQGARPSPGDGPAECLPQPVPEGVDEPGSRIRGADPKVQPAAAVSLHAHGARLPSRVLRGEPRAGLAL